MCISLVAVHTDLYKDTHQDRKKHSYDTSAKNKE